MMNVFSKYAQQVTVTGVVRQSVEADVNINIDVNEGVKKAEAPIETPTIPTPTPASYSNPFEGQGIQSTPTDPTTPDGQTESETSEVVAPPAENPVEDPVADDTTPAEAPDAEEGGEQPGEEASGDSDNPFDKEPTEEGEEEATAEIPKTEEDEALDEEVEEDTKKAEDLDKAVESLESVYETLQGIHLSGVTFDRSHAALAALAINGAMRPIGATCASIAPSLESDNYFELTDVEASMEAIGEAIKSGAKAAGAAILKFLRGMKEWFIKQFDKLRALGKRFYAAAKLAASKVRVRITVPVGGLSASFEDNSGYGTTGNVINEFNATVKNYTAIINTIVSSANNPAKLMDELNKIKDGEKEANFKIGMADGKSAAKGLETLATLVTTLERAKIVDKINRDEKEAMTAVNSVTDPDTSDRRNYQNQLISQYKALRQVIYKLVDEMTKIIISSDKTEA